jgi:superfamily II DNA or RNA helicase
MMETTAQTFQLRDYQARLIQGIYEAWKSNPRVMAQLPTGGGKTVIFSAVADEFIRRSERVLILAHREELILQAASKLEAITRSPVGIVKAGYKPDPLFPIQVASVQSMVNRLRQFDDFGLIVIDEAHHSPAETYRKILGAFPNAYQLGVTATPCRSCGTGFDDLFDALVCGPTVGELIKQGHLSDFKLFADSSPMSTKGAKTVGGDFSANDLAKANDIVRLSGNLLESYHRHCPGKRCLVFAVNVAHSMAIAARYQAEGIPAIHLDGETPTDVRKEALARFAAGEIRVISNCALFGEGLDIPALDAVQIARPTKSLGLWLQMVGRALRPAPGKERAVLIDHTTNWAIHGLPTRRRVWTLEGVEQADEPLEKDATGEIGIKREIEVEEAIAELVEVVEEPADEWANWYWELITKQRLRNYSKGWVYYKLVEAKPPLRVWQEYARYCGYKLGWAKYRFDEQEAGNKESA